MVALPVVVALLAGVLLGGGAASAGRGRRGRGLRGGVLITTPAGRSVI
jgi:hypothetical protein